MQQTAEQIRAVITDKIIGKVQAEHTDRGHFYRHLPTNLVFPSVTTKGSILDAPHLKVWAASEAVKYIDAHLVRVGDNFQIEGDKDQLFHSAVLSHQDQFESAGDVGTRGHKVVESYLNQWIETGIRPPDIKTFITDNDLRIFAIARSAEKFCIEFDVEPIISELLVASVKYEYAGTLDSLMFLKVVKKRGNNPDCKHSDLWQRHARVSLNHKFICRECGAWVDKEFCLVDWKSSNQITKIEYAMQVSAYWQALSEMSRLKPKYLIIVRLDKGQAKYEARQVMAHTKAFQAFKAACKIYDYVHGENNEILPLEPKEKINLWS